MKKIKSILVLLGVSLLLNYFNVFATDIDLTKSLNNENNSYHYTDVTDVQEDIGLSVETTSSGANLVIDWSKFGQYSGASQYANDTKKYEIRGLTHSVTSGFVGCIGQDVKGTYIFLLLDDGEVMYFPMFVWKNDVYNMNYSFDTDINGKVTKDYFKALGPIPNVNGIAKFYTAAAESIHSASGWVTTLSMKSDGSFYDLGLLIDQKFSTTSNNTSSNSEEKDQVIENIPNTAKFKNNMNYVVGAFLLSLGLAMLISIRRHSKRTITK